MQKNTLRGKSKIAKMEALFNDEQTPETGEKKKQQGRSADLIISRNNKLLHRFYYYRYIHRLGFETVIEKLRRDFDLEMYTISKIVVANTEKINELRTKQPTIKALSEMFIMYNWQPPEKQERI